MLTTSPKRVPGLRVPESEGVNPKDLIGAQKVDLSLCSALAHRHWALAQVDGDIKYGPYNWRVQPVQARTYVSAAMRHLQDWLEGEEYASDSLAHHLGHVMACAAILLDAQAAGMMVDNRPIPNTGYTGVRDELTQRAKDRRAKA